MSNSEIKIKLSFTGVIDIKDFSNNSILQINEGSTVGDVLSIIGIRKEHKKYIIAIVNDEKKKAVYVLKNNDHLSLFLPVGGG
jgi:sulfur carrier protein ThiS